MRYLNSLVTGHRLRSCAQLGCMRPRHWCTMLREQRRGPPNSSSQSATFVFAGAPRRRTMTPRSMVGAGCRTEGQDADDLYPCSLSVFARNKDCCQSSQARGVRSVACGWRSRSRPLHEDAVIPVPSPAHNIARPERPVRPDDSVHPRHLIGVFGLAAATESAAS